MPRWARWGLAIVVALGSTPLLLWGLGMVLMEFVWGEQPPDMKGYGFIGCGVLIFLPLLLALLVRWAMARPKGEA